MHGKTEISEPPRRFYKTAAVRPAARGFAVTLDGRGARTPAGAPLIVPSEALAGLLAAEWDAQREHVLIASMPAVRLAFTALDRVAGARTEVSAELARYAGSDLLCYFAEGPEALVERQVQGWRPLLEWASAELDLHLVRTSGIVHQAQPAESLLRAARLAEHEGDFGLAGLAHAAALFGSAVLAFAMARDQLGGVLAFELSRLDEDFQAERWGVDEEAAARAGARKAEAVMLERWFRALEA